MSQLKTIAVRLPEMTIKGMEAVAKSQYMPTRTMIRSWIMQRQGAERMNENPAFGAEVRATTPIADTQPNHEGVIVDGTGI